MKFEPLTHLQNDKSLFSELDLWFIEINIYIAIYGKLIIWFFPLFQSTGYLWREFIKRI